MGHGIVAVAITTKDDMGLPALSVLDTGTLTVYDCMWVPPAGAAYSEAQAKNAMQPYVNVSNGTTNLYYQGERARQFLSKFALLAGDAQVDIDVWLRNGPKGA